MIRPTNYELDKRDVERWTNKLHHKDSFAALRTVLEQHGFKVAELLLAYYAESEDSTEHGVIIKPDGSAYWFHRLKEGPALHLDSFQLEPVEDLDALRQQDPAVDVAVDILKEPAAEA
jgi:hypothetical protein